MKQLTIILLFVSGVALGQGVLTPGSIKTPMSWTGEYIEPVNTNPMAEKEGDIRELSPPKITTEKVVIVTADGTLKMIEAFKVVTSEILTEVYNNPNKTVKHGPGQYSTTLLGGGYSYQWKEYSRHYEDGDHVLSEVYQLIKL